MRRYGLGGMVVAATLTAATLLLPGNMVGTLDVPAQPKAVVPVPKHQVVELLSTPTDAVRTAWAHAAASLPAVRPYLRYVWVQSGEVTDFRGLALALNLASTGSVPTLPTQVNGYLVAVDLRTLAATEDDLVRVLDLWDDFQFDPRFGKILDAVTLQKLAVDAPDTPVARTWKKPKTGERGCWQVPVKTLAARELVAVRLNPEVLEPLLSQLQVELGTPAPVVAAPYLVARLTGTTKFQDKVVKDGKEVLKDNLYSVVWGGRYYEWAGVRKSQTKGVTDLAQLFIDLGLGSKDETFAKFLDRIRGDERAALYQSQVTGKPRRITWVGTPASRLSAANGIIVVTEDLRTRDVERIKDPVYNLVFSQAFAYEVIWTRRNGMLGYGLYGANQELLDFADANEVVADTTVPDPHPKLLLAAVSCVRCHGPHDGWIPFRNEVKEQIPRVLADLRDGRTLLDFKAAADLADRLRGWYTGDPGNVFFLARLQHERSMPRATGRWPVVEGKSMVSRASAALGKLYAADRYDAVTPEAAAASLGLPPTKEALAAAMAVPDDGNQYLEDATVAGLLDGYKVTAVQWALSYSFAHQRVVVKNAKGQP